MRTDAWWLRPLDEARGEHLDQAVGAPNASGEQRGIGVASELFALFPAQKVAEMPPRCACVQRELARVEASRSLAQMY